MRALVMAFALMWLAAPASASQVSVTDLDGDPLSWNERQVTIRGEIVGDYSPRNDEVWVQVNDDAYVDAPSVETGELAGGNVGIGVRIPGGIFDESWGAPGGYKVRGPIVEVTGIFRYADPATGGATFVDASSVTLIDPAREMETPPPQMGLLVAAIAMMAVGFGMWARSRWRLLNPKQ
jgi:hypothetical protein